MEHFDELDRMRNRQKRRGRKGSGNKGSGNRRRKTDFDYDDNGYDDDRYGDGYDYDDYGDGYDDDGYDDGYGDGYDDDGWDDGYGDDDDESGYGYDDGYDEDYDDERHNRNPRTPQRRRASRKTASRKTSSSRAASRTGGTAGTGYGNERKTKNGSRDGRKERNRMGTKRNSKNNGQYDNARGTAGSAKSSKSAKRKKKRKFLLIELLVLAALIFGLFYFMKKGSSGYWTIAIFGVDSRNGNLEKGTLSDVEMLCVVDRKTGEMKLISVYRDTYLQIDDKGTFYKINEAYLKGGHKQAVSALERNLDLKIDDYATFNWKAVADAINILGGIDLEITDSEFKYINSFITETVNSTGIGSHQLKKAGMNHLDGVQAVAYARLRLMDTDFNRTARQRKVLSLAMEKAKQANFSTLNNILVTVLPQISTSIGIDDLIPMAKNINKYHISTTDGFPFSRGVTKINKHSSVIPLTLESNVIQLHQILYGTENYQPSSTVKKISERIAKDSGMGEVAVNAPKVTAGESGKSSGNTAAPPPSTQALPSAPPETSKEAETEPETETTVKETFQETETSIPESSSQEIGPGVGPGIGEESVPSKAPSIEETKVPPTEHTTTDRQEGTLSPGFPGGNDGPGGSSERNPVAPVPQAPGNGSGGDIMQQGPGM